MITEGGAAILLETTQRAFRNQSQSKQRSTLSSRTSMGSIIGLDLLKLSDVRDVLSVFKTKK